MSNQSTGKTPTEILSRMRKMKTKNGDSFFSLVAKQMKRKEALLEGLILANKLPYKEIVAVAGKEEISINWILFGDMTIDLFPSREKVIRMPLAQRLKEGKINDRLIIGEKLLSPRLRKHPGILFAVKEKGDTMSPFLKPGDIVIASLIRPQTLDGLYVLGYPGGWLKTKRIARFTDSGKIMSVNPLYATEPLHEKMPRFRVGCVIRSLASPRFPYFS